MDNQNWNGRWRINYERLQDSLKTPELWEIQDLDPEDSANSYAAKVKEECGEDISHYTSKRRSVHWWSTEISEMRKKVIHLRRTYTRKKRRHSETECTTEYEEWREAKLALTKSIKIAKLDSWKNCVTLLS